MNTQQLEEKSESERLEMEQTIVELRTRLSPGQLIDELLAYTKDGGGEFLSNLGRQATANPLPVTLIGAGLGWFLFSKGQSQSTTAQSSTRSSAGYDGSAGATRDYANDSGLNSAVSDFGGKARDAANSGLDKVGGALSSASERVGDTLSSASQSISDASHTIASSASRSAAAIGETAKAAAGSAEELASNSMAFLKDQPLVLLGMGVALGAAIGAGLPTTQTEEKLMGEASAQVRNQASEMANEQLDKVKEAGQHVYSDIAKSVKEEIQGLAAAREKPGSESGNFDGQSGDEGEQARPH